MEPVLAEEKRTHAENLIKNGYFADALVALDTLARDRSPEARPHAKWARDHLPNVKAALQKSRVECQEACRLAEQWFHDFNYAGAVEVLEKFKRGSRTPEAEELLRESQRALKKVAKLNEKIDRGIYHKETHTDEFFDTLEDLLDLDPKDRRAREWHQKLEKSRHKESHLGWRLGLVLLSLLCLVAVGWVCKLIFWPEVPGTITITVTEPNLTVFINGQVLPPEDFDEKLDRYEAGEHKLELRRGLETIARHTFSIEPNIHKTLKLPEEVEVVNSPPSEPLPPEIPVEPLPMDPVAQLDPEPLPEIPVEPMPMEQPVVQPQPAPPVEPERINGFPIAKQTAYFRLMGSRVTPQYAAFTVDTTRVAAELLTSEPLDPEKTYNVFIWDTATGEITRTITTNSGELQGLAFSPDGKQLATAHVNSPDPNGGILQIWNVETGALDQSLLLSVPPAQETVAIKGVAFSADGKMVGIINQDAAYVWTISDGKLHFHKSFAPSTLSSIGFFPQTEILVLGTVTAGNVSDGITSWDMQQNVPRGLLAAGGSEDDSHPIFTFSRDLSVATVLNQDSIRRYAVLNGRYLSSASLPRFLGEEEVFQKVSYSPSGKYVMASAQGRRPLIWQDSDFTRVAILGETSLVGSYAVMFSSDSKLVFQLDQPDENDFSASAAVIRTWQIPE